MISTKHFEAAKKEFGQHIRRLRKAKGWSQEDLAHEADLHRTHIGMIERGEQNVTFLVFLKLADTLGVHIRDFF